MTNRISNGAIQSFGNDVCFQNTEFSVDENCTGYAVLCESTSKKFRTSKKGKGFARLFNYEEVHAIQNVSFGVRNGEIYGIIGPNGSGKSTIIRMLSTLLIPDSGTITVFDKDVTVDTLGVRQLINRVSVDASFFKKLSVKENLSYAARIYGVDHKEAMEKAVFMLSKFGLEPEKFTSPVEDLSRGQQQMVSIARSLLSSPNLLLLDEPTTGLDPHSKKMVQEFVIEVREKHNTTVILTSHDMTEVEKLCDRIAFIRKGKIWAEGTADNLKKKAESNSLEDVFLLLTGEEFPGNEIPQ